MWGYMQILKYKSIFTKSRKYVYLQIINFMYFYIKKYINKRYN